MVRFDVVSPIVSTFHGGLLLVLVNSWPIYLPLYQSDRLFLLFNLISPVSSSLCSCVVILVVDDDGDDVSHPDYICSSPPVVFELFFFLGLDSST